MSSKKNVTIIKNKRYLLIIALVVLVGSASLISTSAATNISVLEAENRAVTSANVLDEYFIVTINSGKISDNYRPYAVHI